MKKLTRFLGVLVVAAVSAVASESHAQMGAWRAMAGGMTTPNVNGRQMKLYAKTLNLSPAQAEAANDLLSAYEIEYLAAIKRFQEIQQAINQEFMQTGEMEVIQSTMQDAMKKFGKKTTQLEKGLLDDIKTLLDQQQLDQWPALERLHRRSTTINWGSLSGESVDLNDLVEGMRLTPAQASAIAPTLAQYELDLDRELQARNAHIQQQIADSLENGFANFDMDKLQKQAADLREAGRKILELNKRYAAQVQALIPEDKQAEFAEKVRLASHPAVYKKSYPIYLIEAALKLPDLETNQREGLQAIEETYRREAQAINERWAAAITEYELNPPDQNPWAAFMPNRELPEPLKNAKEARAELDKRNVDAVKALLTESQMAQMPERNYRPDLDFNAAPGGK